MGTNVFVFVVCGPIEQKQAGARTTLMRRWRIPSGCDVHNLHCEHLREKYENKFGIEAASKKLAALEWRALFLITEAIHFGCLAYEGYRTFLAIVNGKSTIREL